MPELSPSIELLPLALGQMLATDAQEDQST